MEFRVPKYQILDQVRCLRDLMDFITNPFNTLTEENSRKVSKSNKMTTTEIKINLDLHILKENKITNLPIAQLLMVTIIISLIKREQ